MGCYPLSDPPTEEEVEGLSAYVSGRVWPSYEDDAIELLLRGPEGERLVRFRVRPAEGRRWSEVAVVDAIEEFARSLGQLADLVGSTPGVTPQGILLRLEEHAAIVSGHHPGVEIARGEICSLELGDWLG